MSERGTTSRTRTLPRPSSAPDTPRRDLPDQVVMPLLDRIVRQALDEDYEVVAARKARTRPGRRGRQPVRPPSERPHPERPHPERPRQVAAAVMAVFGVLVAVAAVQTSRNAPEANASRDSLVEQVRARSDSVARLQERIERLRTSNTDLRSAVAEASEAEQLLEARIERLSVRTGLTAVTGPGLRITVEDTPDGDVTQQVRDSDLAILVDGLWSAGAEAISVNGKRLTNLTAFDNVGPAVHIGGTPLSPPYTILAIGDPDTLAADLLESSFGQQWYALVDSLGFVFDRKPADSLSLPAAHPQLRLVRLLTDDEPNRPDEEGPVSAP